MIGRILDTFAAAISPRWGLNRVVARQTLSQILGVNGTQGGYEAAKMNRLNRRHNQSIRSNENSQPRSDISRLRNSSWEMFRNNGNAKKVVRTLESKVIGRGLRPQSQATDASGSPHIAFRRRADALWSAVGQSFDYRGLPGRGGQSMVELQKTALRNVVLGGEVFYRFRIPKKAETPKGRARLFVPPPLRLQLIHADRLDEAMHSEGAPQIFYGIELDADENRVAYHILNHAPSGRITDQKTVRVPGSDMGHLYVSEDIDQFRGVPWFSAALIKMRDTGDYEYNELKAAALAACVVFAYGLSSGQAGFAPAGNDSWSPTDGDGNPVTGVQPGMLINKGTNGSIEMLNPMRPNANAAEFIGHMLRSQATSLPGVKGSTLTGDYRHSSFSSEKAADNDTWPELEGVQDWFSTDFCQPVYERVISAAVASGWFDGAVSPEEFAERKQEFLEATWQGPVARSINPKADAEASRMRVKNGQSSVQREAAKTGCNWQDVLLETKELIDFAATLGLPTSIVDQMLGIEQVDSGINGPQAPTGDDPDDVPADDSGDDPDTKVTNDKNTKGAAKDAA